MLHPKKFTFNKFSLVKREAIFWTNSKPQIGFKKVHTEQFTRANEKKGPISKPINSLF
jgi:hypothetical protein